MRSSRHFDAQLQVVSSFPDFSSTLLHSPSNPVYVHFIFPLSTYISPSLHLRIFSFCKRILVTSLNPNLVFDPFMDWARGSWPRTDECAHGFKRRGSTGGDNLEKRGGTGQGKSLFNGWLDGAWLGLQGRTMKKRSFHNRQGDSPSLYPHLDTSHQKDLCASGIW